MSRRRKLSEFDRKVGLVREAISDTLESIEGKRVRPWNFGLSKDGSVCGILKVDEVSKKELFSLKNVHKENNFKIVLGCNGCVYEIGDAVKKYTGGSAASMKDDINKEISRFRMDLIRL